MEELELVEDTVRRGGDIDLLECDEWVLPLRAGLAGLRAGCKLPSLGRRGVLRNIVDQPLLDIIVVTRLR